MSFRVRLLLALAAVALLPLIAIGLVVRHEMDRRFTAQDDARVDALTAATHEALAEESAGIAQRLASLRDALAADDRFRAAVRGAGDPTYLIDYAPKAMQLTGLSMLQIVDDNGRVVSSGQFRNDYGRVDPTVPHGLALVDARTPTGPLRALARADSVQVGGHQFRLVGGIAVDQRFLRALSPDTTLTVSLSDDTTASGLPRFVITRHTSELDALRASVDRWFATTIAVAALAVLLVAAWLAARVSRPLAVLAERTAAVDLDRLDVDFSSDRDDEIGALSRLLAAMTRRLRVSAVRVRDAERRATVGDLARQVTHDVKNGLAPIRHVLRHLSQVERDSPAELATVFAERRPTLDASVAYLDGLARQYARLTPSLDVRPSDVNAVVRDIAAGYPSIHLALAPDLPPVAADPLVLRRIIENLVTNATDAGGTVTITTERLTDAVRLVVADAGHGMTEAQLEQAFNDFFTTKPDGTGLGLSIVRRLVADLHGTLRVDTAPGAGTRVSLSIPFG
ncbi:MAG TPA: ATP-binding protein [Gemmatimonadaceae bacterium]|nr:ATP-binding protein [Gemmatimonadaceae bacterium]